MNTKYLFPFILVFLFGFLHAEEKTFPNFYNVKSYGAVGDGIHVDTESINSAIEAAAKVGGGTVFFPA
ncbi:MAG TPA: glycosyl hydrolase family 28-related protein, partial [Draconibacterium sp.]|nr:glycosyl hydrolase family 28-related protein [Draconibacterium sp.]